MRKLIFLTILLPLLSAATKPDKGGAMPKPAELEGGIAVYFSPDGNALEAAAKSIGSAKRTLDVQAYLLTTKELLEPIKAAHERGVKVRVIMDAKNADDKYSGATYLANGNVPVVLDAEHKEAHNKVIIIDGETLLTGSFNFTKAADTSNAENLLIITGKPKLCAAYTANFEKHLSHSKPPAK